MKQLNLIFTLCLLFVGITAKAQKLNPSAFSSIMGRSSSSYASSKHTYQSFGLSLTGPKQKRQNSFKRREINLGLANPIKAVKLGQNKFKVSKEKPKPSWGFHVSPYYSQVGRAVFANRSFGKGFTLGVDYEFFLSKRLSLLPGISYGRKWYSWEDDRLSGYKTQELSAYLLSRFRFTNPDRKLVFFAEGSLAYTHEFSKGGQWDSWKKLNDHLNASLGIGAEYKLNDKVTFNAVLGPSWAGSSGFSVSAKFGLRLRF